MVGTLDKRFGKLLKDLRIQKGYSQQELANYSDLDRTYISMLERGLRMPTIDTVFRLAETLSMKPSEMIYKLEEENKFHKNANK